MLSGNYGASVPVKPTSLDAGATVDEELSRGRERHGEGRKSRENTKRKE